MLPVRYPRANEVLRGKILSVTLSEIASGGMVISVGPFVATSFLWMTSLFTAVSERFYHRTPASGRCNSFVTVGSGKWIFLPRG